MARAPDQFYPEPLDIEAWCQEVKYLYITVVAGPGVHMVNPG
jgi:hypothetical protein